MIDQILGRPSPSIRRSQILLVLFFWLWRLYKGDGSKVQPYALLSGSAGSHDGQRRGLARAGKNKSWVWRLWVALVGRRAVLWIARVNQRLKHFTPYQLILGTLTLTYALRHIGDIFGLGIPEPLANLYTRSYYRATWVNTALDAGFASAMAIRPKWLRDVSSVLFGVYYLIYASEGDEVLRKFRALCTVEMLRTTWEKTNNPICKIRLVTWRERPRVTLVRYVHIPRPSTSSRSHLPPVKAMLFFDGTEEELAKATQIVVDYPGGGFIAMGPECHEERLRRWARRTRKPVLGVDYGKAPEYPYPWAIEEGFDAYRTLMETKGASIGIKSGKLEAVLTGDSAGGNICATIMYRILEHPTGIPRPVSIILTYAALDFNFTSWMSPANLRVLRSEQSEVQISGIVHGKDHMRHKSPLSVVDDVQKQRRTRQQSWGQALGAKLHLSPMAEKTSTPPSPRGAWANKLPRSMSTRVANWLGAGETNEGDEERNELASGTVGDQTDSEEDDDAVTVKDFRNEAEKSLRDRVRTPVVERQFELQQEETPVVTAGVQADVVDPVQLKRKTKKAPLGTRLTMTSRVGYFQDRIISPSMMRAMAILYIGPKRNPDFETDYYISPLLGPSHLLADFPPVYLICGERDPFVDDTIIFAGKIREAKKARKAQAEAALLKSAKFGEGLRMSTGSGDANDVPDQILRETDEDWVSMRIIEGWGHGFMQMSSLMREVDSVLIEMADWIDESFERHSLRERDAQEIALAHRRAARESLMPHAMVSPGEHIPRPNGSHVKPVRTYRASGSQRVLGGADLGAPFGGEMPGSDEEDPPIMFTPKTRRKGPPPSRFNPVPRRPSKEKLALHRVSSAPRFDTDETGSSGDTIVVRTPPVGSRSVPISDVNTPGSGPKSTGTFAFFGGRSSASPGQTGPKPFQPASLFAPRRTEGGASPSTAPVSKPTNSLVAAAVAGARAASPALAAAGLVPQNVEHVSEAELMRRRRIEAVFGLGETHSGDTSDEE